MGAGAVFVLLILIAAIVVVGAAVYAIAIRLRAGKLDPEGDTVEALDDDGGGARPDHVRTSTEQRARFISTR